MYRPADPAYCRIKEAYLVRFREQQAQSCLNTVPLTQIEWFPKSGNEGLYGYTYRLSGKIAMREDLRFDEQEKTDTDIHESAHTPDEYETRRITALRMSLLKPENDKYRVNLENLV
jgi:hypothetical protein